MAQNNLLGQIILGYEVKEEIHSGAFGTVYKVIKTNASGQYIRALKHIVIPTQKQYNSVLNSMGGDVSKTNDYFAERLKDIVAEINILNELSEKDAQHIVRYYENDIKVTNSPLRYDIFILMEYLTPLDDYILNNDFTVRDVINLGLNVLEGLRSCHNSGIIHRDIKDDNIFVSSRGEYKIGDFGVSKVLKDSSRAESLKGTPVFLAPEVYQNKGSYTKSVDLYSLGIVLYRMLNYNRNPFLPHYPNQYDPQDEEIAFEKRMNGEIPELPSLGGTPIGNIVIKSISDSTTRFQTADEFFMELKNALDNTSKDILDQKVNFNIISNNTLSDKVSSEAHKNNDATLRESISDISETNEPINETHNSNKKDLFETKSEASPDVREREDKQSETSSVEDRIVNPTPIINDELEETTVLDKGVTNKFIFVIPILIFIIGLFAYFIIIPNIYGKTISFIDWLFSDSQTIINTLRDADTVLPQVHGIIAIGIFWWLWIASFIVSLFFVGRQLNSSPQINSINANMKKNDPYIFIQDISESIKLIKLRRSGTELDNFIYSLKRLEDRLSLESDFGYGDNHVINCENKIAERLQALKNSVSNIEKGNFIENISKLNNIVTEINSMLLQRVNLKKKQ